MKTIIFNTTRTSEELKKPLKLPESKERILELLIRTCGCYGKKIDTYNKTTFLCN